MKEIGCEVTLVTKGGMIADTRDIVRVRQTGGIQIIEHHDVLEIAGRDKIEKVVIRPEDGGNKQDVVCDAVVIQVGFLPNTEFLDRLVRLYAGGEIEIKYDCSTNVPGIFACGDVTNAYGKRIIIATGEGAKAVLKVREYLFEENTREKETAHE